MIYRDCTANFYNGPPDELDHENTQAALFVKPAAKQTDGSFIVGKVTMAKIPLTVTGAEKLRVELQHLKNTERSAVIAAIAEARSHGDLTENAEYDAAKERQGFVEARIAELESKLANAQVIDPKLLEDDGRCVFGTTVELMDLKSETTVTYQIVGDDEADIKAGKISISSPIARALIGKYAGDVVQVMAPGGVREYEIIDVKYI
jgi:transcription elongation factor GreA